jgi:hypothetical protein
MRALSIMQPWASLIVGGPLARGPKRTENRGRALAMVARRLVGERVAIHASKRRDTEAFEDIYHCCFGFGFDAKTECPYATMGEFPLGAVIGDAVVGRVFGPGEDLTKDEARFYVGNDLCVGETWGIRFDDARWFTPIECKGALGFWTVPSDVEQRLEAQESAA